MAVTLANADISVIGAQMCVQENLPVDDLSVHSLSLNPSTGNGGNAILGDTVKVPIYSATGDATVYNDTTNNYETADASQSVTYKDVVISQRKKRTIKINEMDLLRMDVSPILRLELDNLARTIVNDVNATILASNFASVIPAAIGVGAWDSDAVIGLRGLDQIRKYPKPMRKLAMNVPYGIALQKDPVINNHNTLRPEGYTSSMILNSFAGFDGGVYEMEQIADNAENLFGFVTNGCGIAFAMTSEYQNNTPDRYEQTIVDHNGFRFLLRRHKKASDGAIYFTIEAQYGYAVADELGITRLISA
jgi:hypothetical protein